MNAFVLLAIGFLVFQFAKKKEEGEKTGSVWAPWWLQEGHGKLEPWQRTYIREFAKPDCNFNHELEKLDGNFGKTHPEFLKEVEDFTKKQGALGTPEERYQWMRFALRMMEHYRANGQNYTCGEGDGT